MKIYISHSTNFDFKKDLYQPLKDSNLSKNFIFPHEKSLKQNPLKKLFSTKKCDLIIAEISLPSTGQGIELGWANMYKIPIICFHKKGSKYSIVGEVVKFGMIPVDKEKILIETLSKYNWDDKEGYGIAEFLVNKQ